MNSYTSKPVTIRAVQFHGDGTIHEAIEYDEIKGEYFVRTLEGPLTIRSGDWLIEGTEGEHYPCKNSVFQRKYGAPDDNKVWSLFERMQGEIAREIRVLLGEEQHDQRLFDEAQRTRRVDALKKCAAEQTDDATRHEAWIKMHVDSGWTYGTEFDPANKKHPNLLPWGELPASTRSKARIFDICARYADELTRTQTE